MRRFVFGATVLMSVGLAAVVIAQTKITTAEDYQKVMKTAATAFQATNKAIGSGAFADAKTQLATARQNFMVLQTFWSSGKTPDAAGIVKDMLTNLDTLDKQLSAPTVDPMAAQATAKMAQGACGMCHKIYREGDQQTGFKIKAGVL